MHKISTLAVAALLCVTLSGCSGSPAKSSTPSPDTAMLTYADQIHAKLVVVAVAFQHILDIGPDAVAHTDTAELSTACTQLGTAVTAAQAVTPSPDAQLNADMATALDAYATYATDCTSGQLTKLKADAATADTAFTQAAARLTALKAKASSCCQSTS